MLIFIHLYYLSSFLIYLHLLSTLSLILCLTLFIFMSSCVHLDFFDYYVRHKGTHEPVISMKQKFGGLPHGRVKLAIDCFIACLHSPFYTNKKSNLCGQWLEMGKSVRLIYRVEHSTEIETNIGDNIYWKRTTIPSELKKKNFVDNRSKVFLPWLQYNTIIEDNTESNEEVRNFSIFFSFHSS